jgi:hypothetical protein
LGDLFADFLVTVMPGLDWDSAMRSNLAEAIVTAAEARNDVYVVFRDELQAGTPPAVALVDGFGAEAGDEVVEVRPAATSGALTSRRWRISSREVA